MDTEAEAERDSGSEHSLWSRPSLIYDRFFYRRQGVSLRTSLLRTALFAAIGLCIATFFLWDFGQGDSVEVIVQSSQHDYSKEAYVTLLAPQKPHPWSLGEPDYYFESCKIKAHRLLRNTTTRDPYNRPYVILVTPDVPLKQIEILELHGAIVKRVPIIEPPLGTITPDLMNPRYRDQFTKLHVWNMTEYDRVAFFDADALPIRPIHSIFDTPTEKRGDEEWLFAAVYDSGELRMGGQRNPPGPEDKGRPQDNQLNAGVFLLSPTQTQADYIWDLMHNPPPGIDFSIFMEQQFLRWAYRDDGPYPWIRLSHLYNTLWAKDFDLDTAYVLHDKLWGAGYASVEPGVREVWFQAWGEMVGWDATRYFDGIRDWYSDQGPDISDTLQSSRV